ncbi:hypothetical protein WICPIJ_000250 [Wickerhamomyces pijperi]|uniref:Uncharacterized protein n=1 Tax=Wickerhamomyces pijperi TaxID=599730 RepID=A0A9P8TR01_WICPI|nr:hypothetical protein WICPIJ_000250 [Wickerhamomyces pijperi]
MNWFFSSAADSPATTTSSNIHQATNPTASHQISESEQDKELQLLNELTPQLRQFYNIESRSNHPFTEQDLTREQIEKFTTFRKDPANSEKELSQFHCSEHQLRYLRCLTADKSSRLRGKCLEDSKTVEKCLAFQKQLFYKLGLRYTKDVEKFQKISNTADQLGDKWIDRVRSLDHGLDEVVLNDVYDSRDRIWSRTAADS